MSLFESVENLVDNGQYIDALKVLYNKMEAVQEDSSTETYDFLAIQNKIAEVFSKQGYYDEALNLFTDIHKKLSEFGDTYEQEIIAVEENIGNVFVDRKDYDHALNIFEEIYKYRSNTLGLDNPLTIQALRNVAIALSKVRRYEEAMIRLTLVHKYKMHYLGIDHKSTIQSCRDIAKLSLKRLDYDKALLIFKETCKYLEHKLPLDWDTLLAWCNLANVYKIQHNYADAFKIYGEVYLVQTKMKPRHPDTLSTLRNLVELFEIQEEHEKCLLLLNKIYCIRSSECPMHPDTIEVELAIASKLLKQEKFASALHFFNTVLNKISVTYGVHHDSTIEIQKRVALELYNNKIFELALNVFKGIHNAQCEMYRLGSDHPDTLLTKIYLGKIYLSLSRFSEAVKEFKDVLEKVKMELGPNNVECIVAGNNIAEIYNLQKKLDQAYETNNIFYQTRLLTLGEGHPETVKARQNIAIFKDIEPKSSLVKAVIANDFNDVKFAVEIQDADVNARDVNGCTALHVSSERGNTDIVKYLLSKGAIYNVENKCGKSPMDIASNDQIKFILKSVATLFAAVNEGNFEVVFQVVRKKASVVNSRDENGNTPLLLASAKRDIGTVKFLLYSGADPNLMNNNGDVTIYHSC